MGDAGVVEMAQRVEQRLVAVIQDVVVREADPADPARAQDIDGGGAGTEGEGLADASMGDAAVGDRAFEVAEDRGGPPQDGQGAAPETLRRAQPDLGVDHPAQHDVTHERQGCSHDRASAQPGDAPPVGRHTTVVIDLHQTGGADLRR
jgi:hypothetical protein